MYAYMFFFPSYCTCNDNDKYRAHVIDLNRDIVLHRTITIIIIVYESFVGFTYAYIWVRTHART